MSRGALRDDGALQGYPTSWEIDRFLLDGEPVHIGPLRPDDVERLSEFHAKLSSTTVYYRYFATHAVLPASETRAPHRARQPGPDGLRRRRSRPAFGVGRYEWDGSSREAEVAFVVADGFQRRGVGTLLLERLAAYAREQGIERFVAELLPENPGVIRVFRASGHWLQESATDGVVCVTIDLGPPA
ncbi:MAG: hypothetical protein JWO62_2704 [Acidimicrobiaceae bacterium]|jgi:RimJ/RimL family protein N-acetyltransferase|nr:hypothetical protein [Acidimicrobiaceae bacterium]